jgi:imidazolonepropionase-like amidohydrolase
MAHHRLLPHRFFGVAILSLWAVSWCAGLARVDSDPKAVLALVGGHLRTMTGLADGVGTVLIADGKITAIGPDVKPPPGATMVDVAHHTVTPGLIDARSSLWLSGTAARESGRDGSFDILDEVDPYGRDWVDVAAQGVTAVYVQPANNSSFGGSGAVLRVAPAGSVIELVMKSPAAFQAALGVGPNSGDALARHGQFEALRRLLNSVKSGSALPATPGQAPRQGPPTGNRRPRRDARLSEDIDSIDFDDLVYIYHYLQDNKDATQTETNPATSGPAPGDAQRKRLQALLKRELPVRIEAHREDDVRNALRLADEFNLKVVLEGVSNPGSALEVIRTKRIPLIVGPLIQPDGPVPSYRDQRPAGYPAAIVAESDRWAIGTFSSQPRGSAWLRVHAAEAVRRGLSGEAVLQALTLQAAQVLGVGDLVGSLAVGKQADIAVFAGDPLDPSVPATLVISKGRIVHQRPGRPNAATGASDSVPALPRKLPARFTLKGTQVYRADGTLGPGEFVVADGRVADAKSGRGGAVIDVGNAIVTPGLIVWSGFGQDASLDEQPESWSRTPTAWTRFDTETPLAKAWLREGASRLLFAPGQINVAGSIVHEVRLGSTAASVAKPLGRRFSLTRLARNPERYPASLMGQVELLEMALAGRSPAVGYYLADAAAGQFNGGANGAPAGIWFVDANTAGEIAAAVAAVNNGQRLVLVKPNELKPVISEAKAAAVIFDTVPTGDHRQFIEGVLAAEAAGMRFGFAGASPQEARVTAALAVNAGLARASARRALLASVTDSAWPGSAGSPADFVVWSGDPLDLRAKPVAIVVDGRRINLPPLP